MKKYKEPYGYLTQEGYIGYVNLYKKFMLFETEDSYIEYINSI